VSLRSKRTISFVQLILITGIVAHAQGNPVAVQAVSLNDGWEFRQSGATAKGAEWLPALVPGDVHLDLLRNKVIPEPFYRQNEAKLQWIEDTDWEYRKTFSVSDETLAHRHVEMVFQGLDTTATVLLNDKLVLQANDMFRPWRIDVKPFLHSGSNTLRVKFSSDVREGERLAKLDATREETHIPEKAFVRKAAYEYGWDWGPRFVTSGIWQPVSLELWDDARVENLLLEQPDVSPQIAHVVAKTIVDADHDAEADVIVTWQGGGASGSLTEKTLLHPGMNVISIPVEIKKPDLWFPNGYGKQPLYQFKTSVRVGGRTVDERESRTGLRKIVLRQDVDQWGRQFAFEVNGILIFVKGADVIPFDSFPARVTTERYKQFLGAAVQAHMNMVRLWGGGYYESDEFYNLCDEMGLLVWQDFMFASSWYPGTEEWKKTVQEEAEYQVSRLRNHPSIALWSGNNEVESVLYGFLGNLSADGKLQVWKNYLTTFSGVLPRVTERIDPEIPYWPSSPSSDYEKTSDEFEAGDAHDWSIWHGREPFANYRKHFYRFTSEYGFQSFPELKTVESFTAPEDRANIFTPTMLAHQKNNEGNSIIHEYMLRDYSEPKDFASFLYVSQVLQAEGIKVGAEHMRRNRPRIMGSLFWQLNDCWPVASWSSMDSFGRWKALQYYARRFYSPILASPDVQDGHANVFIVSDKTTPVDGRLRTRIMTIEGHVVLEESEQVSVPPLSAARYMDVALQTISAREPDLSRLVMAVDLKVGKETVSENLVYLAPTKQVQLPTVTLAHSLVKSEGGYTLRLSANALARDVYVSFGDLDVTPSDNYFDLLPGESREISLKSTATLQELQASIKVMSLADAFDAKTSTAQDGPK